MLAPRRRPAPGLSRQAHGSPGPNGTCGSGAGNAGNAALVHAGRWADGGSEADGHGRMLLLPQ
eukprot:3644100-Rhodomonas_salina.1